MTGDNGDYWGFGHASRFAWAEAGSRAVNAGDVIAFVGTSGSSTGPHLHIAYKPKGAGSYQDPFDVLTDFGGRAPRRIPPTTNQQGDEIDMADIEELRTEFVNQDARTRAYIDMVIAGKDTRDRMFMTALVAKATKAIGGDDALDRLRAELSRKR